MTEFLAELAKINPVVLGVVGAFFGMIGAVIAALITGIAGKLVVTPFLGARDKQDREVEWRKHAIELTKLDLDRKIKTRLPGETEPLRPSILDFLANYRDLQELGQKTPKELYLKIKANRISQVPSSQAANLPEVPTIESTVSTATSSQPQIARQNLPPAAVSADQDAAKAKVPARKRRAPPKQI